MIREFIHIKYFTVINTLIHIIVNNNIIHDTCSNSTPATVITSKSMLTYTRPRAKAGFKVYEMRMALSTNNMFVLTKSVKPTKGK